MNLMATILSRIFYFAAAIMVVHGLVNYTDDLNTQLGLFALCLLSAAGLVSYGYIIRLLSTIAASLERMTPPPKDTTP